MPNVVSITFAAGEDYTQPFIIKSADGSTITDITGFTLQLAFQRYADPTGTTWPFLVTKSGTVDVGPSGTCHVTFASADTLTLEPRSYWYYLRRVDPGTQADLCEGPLVLMP